MISLSQMLIVDEGLRNRAYKDTKGNITVGIGFNMDDIHARGTWIHADVPESFNLVYNNAIPLSSKSIASIFNVCITNCKNDLLNIFPYFTSYPDYVQMALINLMFNMGKPVFQQFHTFIQLIKDKDYDGASNDILTTKYASELKQRSTRISKLIKGDDSGYTACMPDSNSDDT